MSLLPLLLVSLAYTVVIGILLLRPTWLKHHIRHAAARRSLIIVLSTIGVSLWVVLASQLWSNWRKPSAPEPTTNGPTVWDNYSGRVRLSPQSGKLTYRFAKPLAKNQPAKGRIAIITPEVRPERLTQLNSEVLKQLKDDGNIAGETQIFYLDYFDDEAASDGYFVKQADKSVDEATKQKLKQHYVGTMMYNQKLGLRMLFYVPTGKVIQRL